MNTAQNAPISLAYVSEGSLFVWRQGEVARKVESAFARQVRDRAVAMDRKHAWKGKGKDARYRAQVWGRGAGESEAEYHYVSVSDVCADGARLIYALQSGQVSGVFRVETDDPSLGDAERRLFHTTDMAVVDLGGVEQHGYIACSLRGDKGASHIAVLHEDGSEVTELTGGDSIDGGPCWVPGRDRVLVYQSAGIHRDAQGNVVRFAPSLLQQLDVAAGELVTALEEPGHDLFAPKVDHEGTLLCLRRRYQSEVRVHPWQLALRVLTSPFWLLYALIVWLGVFIQRYTGKPMVEPGRHAEETGQGPVRARVRVDAADAVQAEDNEAAAEPLPQWVSEQELIRCTRAGKPELVARGVIAFDVTSDGRIVASDGRALFTLDAQGRREPLLRAKQISAVCVLQAHA